LPAGKAACLVLQIGHGFTQKFRKEMLMLSREEILQAIDELYKEGLLVKALDPSGQLRLRNGQQVYKAKKCATDAEMAFWRRENGIN
jgi:hypothetical protein